MQTNRSMLRAARMAAHDPSAPQVAADEPAAPEVPADVDASDMRTGDVVRGSTRAALMAQPKVRVRLREDTFVAVNGYPFRLAGREWIEVPQTVAEILEQGDRL